MILTALHDFFAMPPEDRCYQDMRWVENWGRTILENPDLSRPDRANIARIVELAGQRIRQIVVAHDLSAQASRAGFLSNRE